MMNTDLNNLPIYQIHDYRYETWFEKLLPNGVTINETQRRELIQLIDSDVACNNSFLNLIVTSLKESDGKESEYHTIERVISNAWLFTSLVTSDCMVACKYFLLADREYDRRYLRGKLKVILNEGIKKLVGFNVDKKEGKVWTSISGIMKHFTDPLYQKQFAELDQLLQKHVSQSSWWKEERDAETHLDTLGILESRQEELDDSTVMIESLQLIKAIDAVSHFLKNLHAGLTNWLNDLYREHPEQFVQE